MSIYGLTEREQEVTHLVLRGGSTTDLAKQLDVSPHTVPQHLKSIFGKTGVTPLTTSSSMMRLSSV